MKDLKGVMRVHDKNQPFFLKSSYPDRENFEITLGLFDLPPKLYMLDELKIDHEIIS